MTDRVTMRKQIRQRRNALSEAEQSFASEQMANHAESLARPFQNVALYLTADGEIDTGPLINKLKFAEKNLAFPVLHPFCEGNLIFEFVDRETQWQANRFGIAEPALDVTKVCPVDQFDVIFLPLVAFDKEGNRLGMGGGYYDRTLSKLNTYTKKPTLIGLAHDCQEVKKLPFAPWDVPLNAIVTPSKILTI